MTDLARINRLSACEARIENGIKTFIDVGNALLEIKQDKLYLSGGYDSWTDYCLKRWGFTTQYAGRLARAAEVVGVLQAQSEEAESETIVSVLPVRETQVKPLTRLEPEDQPDAWRAAVKQAGGSQPTARQVEAAAAPYLPQPPKPAPPTVEEAKVTAETEGRTPKPPHAKKDERKDPHSEAVRELAKIKKGVDHIIDILYRLKDKDSLKALNLNVVNNLIEVPPEFFNIPINGHSFTLDEFRSRWHTCCDRLLTTLRSTQYVADDPPLLADVLAYAEAEALDAEEAERFYHHHASTGWRAGRKWMTSWQAGLRFWLSNAARYAPAEAEETDTRRFKFGWQKPAELVLAEQGMATPEELEDLKRRGLWPVEARA